MARVALIGAHGKVAMLTIPMLAAHGHEVTGIYRNLDHTAEVAEAGAVAMCEDVERMDEGQLTTLLTGHDVVIWSAGAGGGNPERTYAVDRDAAIRSMDAAVRARVPRYLMVSYLGAGPDHGVEKDNPFFAYAEAKAAADEHLRRTPLQWTVLQPSVLTDGPAHGTLDPAPTGRGDTPRALVAEVLTALVEADPAQVARCDVPFTDGDVPIAEALTRLRPVR